MKTLWVLIAACALAMVSAPEAGAQSWLEKLGKKAAERVEDRAKKKVEDKVNKAADDIVDGAFGKAEDAVKGNDRQQQGNVAAGAAAEDGQAPTAAKQSLEITYAKNDFVPGDEIIFSDDQSAEQLGEFPSMWDLLHGNAEVSNVNGEKVIYLEAPSTRIAPLMKDMKSYLSDVFTLEFDFWCASHDYQGKYNEHYIVNFYDEGGRKVMTFDIDNQYVRWRYRSPSDEERSGEFAGTQVDNAWRHLSISFNKRAFKAYVDGSRVTNIPSMAVPVRFDIEREHWADHLDYIKNIRVAKGAVPLYDRMMRDGKFITYGITFDVGKSTIKPESMGEINRIVTLMTENPTLNFSVEGHTDSTGNAASNQTLSEARSAAIVSKLVELGIAADRLTASGKGQNNPIANNSTDEGRAKNRRVEFVKI